MFVDRYVPKTNQRFILLMVGFQFHFNGFNGVEKIVDEKTITSIHPHALNEKMALFGLWTRPHSIFRKTVTCQNST